MVNVSNPTPKVGLTCANEIEIKKAKTNHGLPKLRNPID